MSNFDRICWVKYATFEDYTHALGQNLTILHNQYEYR
jgi:hypothetical protein